MQLRAKLIEILPAQTGEGKNGPWKKNTIIVETEDRYPKKVCVTYWGDDKANENDLQIGNMLDVNFDLESREFNGKWYTDVRAWKVERAASGAESGSNEIPPFVHAVPPMSPDFNPAPSDYVPSGDSQDELPF